MKTLFLGILLIIIVGIGGLVYRNAVERSSQPVACPMDAKVCPDGTAVARTGLSCTFPACPPPNVSLPDAGISYAVPEGFTIEALPDAASIAAYAASASSTVAGELPIAEIVIRRFAVGASSTPLATIQATAIGGASGAPISATAFSSSLIGNRQFTVAAIERFEGVVDTAFYLSRPDQNDVLRFDAIDRGVVNWTDSRLDVMALPAAAALNRLLTTLQVQEGSVSLPTD